MYFFTSTRTSWSFSHVHVQYLLQNNIYLVQYESDTPGVKTLHELLKEKFVLFTEGEEVTEEEPVNEEDNETDQETEEDHAEEETAGEEDDRTEEDNFAEEDIKEAGQEETSTEEAGPEENIPPANPEG